MSQSLPPGFPAFDVAELAEIEDQYRNLFIVFLSIDGLAQLYLLDRRGVEDMLAGGARQAHPFEVYGCDGAGLRAATDEMRRRGQPVSWDGFVAKNELKLEYLAATYDPVPSWLSQEDREEALAQVEDLAAEHGKTKAQILAGYRWSSRLGHMRPAVPEELL